MTVALNIYQIYFRICMWPKIDLRISDINLHSCDTCDQNIRIGSLVHVQTMFSDNVIFCLNHQYKHCTAMWFTDEKPMHVEKLERKKRNELHLPESTASNHKASNSYQAETRGEPQVYTWRLKSIYIQILGELLNNSTTVHYFVPI